MRILLTFCYTPEWASDSAYWDDPPNGMPAGYSPRYPVADRALVDMTATAQMLATRYAGVVSAYECWNEPNLWGYIYPQRTASDAYFAARTYLKYLKAFSAGVRSGDPYALVVAGATAPIGLNDRYRTSPQRFARFLKANGAAAYFDVYSHHPYTPGGTRLHAPGQLPNDPSTTVVLGNLSTLLKIFPTKPFYLTEYGYNTKPSLDFGGFVVSETQQAAYLRKAFAYVKRFSQVKALFWYLDWDARPDGAPADEGVYTGLRRVGGARKPSWFAFAGGNRITVTAPTRARRRTTIRISGTLTNRAVGAVAGRRLVLQSRRLSRRHWSTLKSTRTRASGRYRFYTRTAVSRAYRVVWRGVKRSPAVKVRVR